MAIENLDCHYGRRGGRTHAPGHRTAPLQATGWVGLPVSHVTEQHSKQGAAELNACYSCLAACWGNAISRACSPDSTPSNPKPIL